MSPSVVDTHRFTAFGGARCEVLTVGAGAGELSAAVAEVYAFEAALSRFRPESELSRFNAAAGRREAVSPLLEALLRAALAAHALSDGLVNAAVLPALRAAGYDQTIERVRRRTAQPDAGLGAAAAVPALDSVLEVGDGWAWLAPRAALDLGGVGKGWLADALNERFANAVVNLGGDLSARGEGPMGQGWTVGLCDGSTVAVRDAGVATSGVGGRRWVGGHHLVDPRSGRPTQTDVAAISVVAAGALQAECLAKAAVLIGRSVGAAWARARGALRVAVAAADGRAA